MARQGATEREVAKAREPSVSGLFLARGTVIGRPASLHDALDLAAAILGGAGLALAVIDGEMMLEITELAIGFGIIAQGRTAGFDRSLKHLLDRRHEALCALACHR